MHNDDLFVQLCCSEAATVLMLGNMASTCKTAREYLMSTAGGIHWYNAARRVCGEAFWREWSIPNQPHANNLRYNAMLRLCPWLSVPRTLDVSKACETIKRRYMPESYTTIWTVAKRSRSSPKNPFMDIRIDATSTEEFEEARIYKVCTNPRPFGPNQVSYINDNYREQDYRAVPTMSAREMGLLEDVRKFVADSPSTYGVDDQNGCVYATMVHDGAVAIHVGLSDEAETEVMFFGTKPLRFLCNLVRPERLHRVESITFGVGEMWAAGYNWKKERDDALYVGPRRDKRVEL